MLQRIKHKNTFYFTAYTLIFLLMSLIIFSPFIIDNKSFIWKFDGLYQTYSSMLYIKHYYISLITNFFSGDFTIPLVDFTIGLGYDIPTTMNYYGLGDPLLFFTIFFKDEHMQAFYSILTILRFYLCGLSFSIYCLYMKKDYIPTATGAFIYLFCGFALYGGTRHPYFLNPMIYLPLLFVCIEKILKNKKGSLFTVMIFISVLSNYYFFYMLTILCLFYALTRFIALYHQDWKTAAIKIIPKGIFHYLAGVGMAGFILLPSILALSSSSRSSSVGNVTKLYYYFNYYRKALYTFFSPAKEAASWTNLNYAALCIVCIVILYTTRRKWTSLKIIFALLSLGLMTPIFGQFMNGMSYAANRWIFGYSFLAAFIVTTTFRELFHLSRLQKVLLCLMWIILFLYLVIENKNHNLYYYIGMSVLLFTIAIPVLLSGRCKSEPAGNICILLLTAVSICLNGFCLYSSSFSGYASSFRENGQAQAILASHTVPEYTSISDLEFHRIVSDGTSNAAFANGQNGIDGGYFSIINEHILTFYNELEISSKSSSPHSFKGFDNRSALETLAAAKYYLVSDITKTVPSYGYTPLDNTTQIYENNFFLPLGYTYKNTISSSDTASMNGLEKQETMLQAAILEDYNTIPDKPDITFAHQNLPYTLEYSEGITWNKDDNSLIVSQQDAKLFLAFDAVQDSETYLRFSGLDISESSSSHFSISVDFNGRSKKLSPSSSTYKYHVDVTNYLVNLGYGLSKDSRCEIIFPEKGIFKLEDLALYSLPMSAYEEQISQLSDEVMENIQVSTNNIRGTLDISSDKTLVLSIPYLKGWNVKVNGEPVNPLRANYAFMGLALKAGSYDIELSYCTPGLKAGIAISLFSLILYVAIGIRLKHFR